MQSQHNDIKDDDDIKLLLAYIRKIQNTTDVGIIVQTETVIGKRGLDIIIRMVRCIIG